MKLPLLCRKCAIENIVNKIRETVEVKDNGIYSYTCSNGHKSQILLHEQKFEVLFEIGAFAILDGYYREAVSSFTSSLERFYEFVICVFCISKGIDRNSFIETWKSVSNQSERQLGAFIFLYLHELGYQPDLLKNKDISFRNSVIHKGLIPTKEEALKYGQKVLDLIRPIMFRLKDEYNDAVVTTLLQSPKEKCADRGVDLISLTIPTIIGLTIDESSHHHRDLETAIAEIIRW